MGIFPGWKGRKGREGERKERKGGERGREGRVEGGRKKREGGKERRGKEIFFVNLLNSEKSIDPSNFIEQSLAKFFVKTDQAINLSDGMTREVT